MDRRPPKRRSPGHHQAPGPSKEYHCIAKNAEAVPEVKNVFDTEAKTLAFKIGMLEKLPILLELFEPTSPKGRVVTSDTIKDSQGGETTILVILGRSFGWVAFESKSADAIQQIQEKILRDASSLEIDTQGDAQW